MIKKDSEIEFESNPVRDEAISGFVDFLATKIVEEYISFPQKHYNINTFHKEQIYSIYSDRIMKSYFSDMMGKWVSEKIKHYEIGMKENIYKKDYTFQEYLKYLLYGDGSGT